MSNRDKFDICVVGAGVIGLATAYELARAAGNQSRSIVLLEQEASFGQHISARNSEVIHAGIYYAPDSLKARLCVDGKALLYEHCQRFEIPHRRVGKLIVAKEAEIEALHSLKSNAEANGVLDLEYLDRSRLRKLEPSVAADAALLSPSTGIIDSHSYMLSLLHLAQNLGVQYSPYSRVERIEALPDGFGVSCQIDEKRNPVSYRFNCTQLVNAAGLGAQSVAETIDALPKAAVPRLYYCKGDYFDYLGQNPFSHLIYPTPEPNGVGLGVHATMDMASRLRFGPDTEYIEQPAFTVDENKAETFAQRIVSYFPGIQPQALKPAYAGIRPKLAAPGETAADFLIQDSGAHGVPGLVQLFGMESPGLTASLAIAGNVSKKILNTAG